MNLADCGVLILLAVGIFFALRALRRGKGRCGGSCEACGRCSSCSSSRKAVMEDFPGVPVDPEKEFDSCKF